jgi:hypothetical protein
MQPQTFYIYDFETNLAEQTRDALPDWMAQYGTPENTIWAIIALAVGVVWLIYELVMPNRKKVQLVIASVITILGIIALVVTAYARYELSQGEEFERIAAQHTDQAQNAIETYLNLRELSQHDICEFGDGDIPDDSLFCGGWRPDTYTDTYYDGKRTIDIDYDHTPQNVGDDNTRLVVTESIK